MANKKAIYHDVENSESSENLSHDEWTIIGENCTEKDDNDYCNNSDDRTDKDQEPFRSLEIIEPQNDDVMDDETRSVTLEKHGEDSDGISVITESEAEQLVVNKKFSESDACRNHLCGALKMYENTGEKTAPQVGTIFNVVIACSLAAIIGLGAGRILGMDDKCPVTNAVDFSTIKIESDMLINQIKELSEVKEVLDEIKASIPKVKRTEGKVSRHGSKSMSKRSERREKSSIISDTYIFDPDTTILEQLQNSLNSLCSVIDGMNPENDFIKSDTTRTQGVVADLIEFQKIIYTVVEELGDAGGHKEMEFLRQAEKRIRDVCESLLSDLSYTVHGLTVKIHHKLNKVRHKLNKRLCLLKNSESKDGRIFKSLEEDNSFLESCDKILNATLKPNPQSVKNSKKEKPDKRIRSIKITTTEKSSRKKSTSESEDDIYPRDSSSDSSMPDLTYNSDNDDFWRKKVKRGKQAKPNPGKIVLENDLKRRKIRNAKPLKSSRRQCVRKLMTEVLIPADTCSPIRQHRSELKSTHPKTPKIGVPILNEKPLYSVIAKSVANSTSAAKNNIDEAKLSEKWILQNTQAQVTAETITEIDQEFRGEVGKTKENLTETKHHVTPAESGINNFQTAKGMKERFNTKIRQPIGKYDGVQQDEKPLRRKDISREKYEDRIPPITESLEHCQKGKKCSNNSSATTASGKRFPSSTRNTDNDEQPKISTEKSGNKTPIKTRNDGDKKERKAKLEGKTSLPSKITDTKNEKGFKKRYDNKKMKDQLADDWQLQRSRAREMQRDRDHRSEWFFDRADSRQDARKNIDLGQSAKCYRRDKCVPIFEERMHDEESYDYWHEAKRTNSQKYSNGRAGFAAKKMAKMHHRKNIMQSKRR